MDREDISYLSFRVVLGVKNPPGEVAAEVKLEYYLGAEAFG